MAIILNARVQQKTGTEAQWLASTLPLLPGEIAFVRNSNGTAITNFKVNTYSTNRLFNTLPYYFDASMRVPFFGGATLTGTPSPASGDGFWIAMSAGTYTNYGGVVLPASSFGIITRIGAQYSIVVNAMNLDTGTKDWTAKLYNQGESVFYNGNIYVASVAIISSEVPGVSEKWVAKIQVGAENVAIDEYDGTMLVQTRWVTDGATIGSVYNRQTVNGYGSTEIRVYAGEIFELESFINAGMQRYLLLNDSNVIMDMFGGPANMNTGSPITINVMQNGWLLLNVQATNSTTKIERLKLKRVRPLSDFAYETSVRLRDLEVKADILDGKILIETVTKASFTIFRAWQFGSLAVGQQAPANPIETGSIRYMAGRIKVRSGEVAVLRVGAGLLYKDYVVTNDAGTILSISDSGLEDSTLHYVKIDVDGWIYATLRDFAPVPAFQFHIYRDYIAPYKVLVFSNSYSEGPLTLMNQFVNNTPGIEQRNMCVYRFNHGGAPLTDWLTMIRENQVRAWTRVAGLLTLPIGTIRERIAHDWDMITVQQQSVLSLNKESIDASLPILVEYVKKYCTNKAVKLAWHFTQAVPQTGGWDVWPQLLEMAEYVKYTYGFDVIIPTGTAVENLRETPYIGPNNGAPDNSHLGEGTPLYAAACAWFQVLFADRYSVSILGNATRYDWAPAPVDETNYRIIQLCGIAAAQSMSRKATWIMNEVNTYGM